MEDLKLEKFPYVQVPSYGRSMATVPTSQYQYQMNQAMANLGQDLANRQYLRNYESGFHDSMARLGRELKMRQPAPTVRIKERKPKPGPSPLRQVTQGRSIMGGRKSRRKSLQRRRK